MNDRICFIVLPGLAPDPLSLVPLKDYLEARGYAVILTNFTGDLTTKDFSKVTIDGCLQKIGALIKESKQKYPVVVGIGVSLGGALFIEYAKTHKDLDYIVSVGTPFKLKNHWLLYTAVALAPILHPMWKVVWPSQRSRPLPVEAAAMSFHFFEGRFQNNLEKITTPTLFLHSKKDPVTDRKAVFEKSKKFVNAPTKMVLSPNGGHEINYDPQLIAENFFEFYKSCQKYQK